MFNNVENTIKASQKLLRQAKPKNAVDRIRSDQSNQATKAQAVRFRKPVFYSHFFLNFMVEIHFKKKVKTCDLTEMSIHKIVSGGFYRNNSDFFRHQFCFCVRS